jgi:hypothetical protein
MSKAYRDEFREFAGVGKQANMASLLDELANRLADRVDDRANLLHIRAEAFEGKVLDQVEKQANKATDKVGKAREFGQSSTNRRLAQLKGATRAAMKGESKANKATDDVNSLLMMTTEGVWMSDTLTAEYFSGDNTLELQATHGLDGGGLGTLTIRVQGVAGVAPFILSQQNSDVEYVVEREGEEDVVRTLVRGNFRVLEFDLAAPRINVRFAIVVSEGGDDEFDLAAGRPVVLVRRVDEAHAAQQARGPVYLHGWVVVASVVRPASR